MSKFSLPYGRGHLSFDLPDVVRAKVIEPVDMLAAPDLVGAVEAALNAPVGGADVADFQSARSAAIAISDKTRPVPHRHLLPPLLHRLENLGLSPGAIRLIIATGTHSPMPREEYRWVVPEEIVARYPVLCHNADDRENLVQLGTTSRSTPVWVNRRFFEADLRIVVGNIEPHLFQGFSGGVKSAAIGLAGRDTVNRNHAMMTDHRAQLGRYSDNPTRQDVELDSGENCCENKKNPAF